MPLSTAYLGSSAEAASYQSPGGAALEGRYDPQSQLVQPEPEKVAYSAEQRASILGAARALEAVQCRKKAPPKHTVAAAVEELPMDCLLYTSPSPRDVEESRMPSSA